MNTATLWNPLLWAGIGGTITFIFCCILGSNIIVSHSLIYSWHRGKKFFELYAKQTLKLALFFIFVYITIVATGTIYLIKATSHPLVAFTLKGICSILQKNYILALPFEGIFLSFFLCFFLYLFWNILKKTPILRILFSILSMSTIWLSIYLIINCKVVLLSKGLYSLEQMNFSKLLIPSSEISIILLFIYLVLAIGSAGGANVLFLLLRRKREDYGRDYYKFAIPLSCKWNLSLLFTIPVTILILFISYRENSLEINPILYTSFLLSIFLIGCAWINIKIIKSPQPLRLKELIFLSPAVSLATNIAMIYILMLVVGRIILRT